MPVPIRLVLVRHGQSIWNVENLFTGWTDVDLSAHGCEEARQAGRELARAGFVMRTMKLPDVYLDHDDPFKQYESAGLSAALA